MMIVLKKLLRLNRLANLQYKSVQSSSAPCFNVAVVGAGPAGFYCCQSLLRILSQNLSSYRYSVDLFEKLPVPYGLVRFGVAPDHPEVKNCIHSFEKLAEQECHCDGRLSFFGNVTVGRDISLLDLRKAYHAVVLAYGSEKENPLLIPGAEAENCFSARSFVNWYNGYPNYNGNSSNLSKYSGSSTNIGKAVKLVGLKSDVAVILGHGNVALDVARILLSPIEHLFKTDINADALDALAQSQIRKVILIGRRGPLQVSFTIAELREMTKMPDCLALFDKSDFTALLDGRLIEKLDRPKRRLTQLMTDTANSSVVSNETEHQKSWSLKFSRSPAEILTDARNYVSAIDLRINRLIGDDSNHAMMRAVPVEPPKYERIDCGLIVYSLGQKTLNLSGSESLIYLDPQERFLRTVNNDCCRLELKGGRSKEYFIFLTYMKTVIILGIFGA